MSKEFSIIKHYFQNLGVYRQDVIVGNGDDAAVVNTKESVVVTTDTFIPGIHCPLSTSAHAIGYKALAVNLSDLAAMGAKPAWFTLALTLPSIDNTWLLEFSKGLASLAYEYAIQLIGGDTTKGSLSITIQAMGLVTDKQYFLRNQAQLGDGIYITGEIGDAYLGLKSLQDNLNLSQDNNIYCKKRLDYPSPRVRLALALQGIAHAMIDISDGLLADISHILQQSSCGACIDLNNIAYSKALSDWGDTRENKIKLITAGDDYELCFTAPIEKEKQIQKLSQQYNISINKIGVIQEKLGLQLLENNSPIFLDNLGFQHF